MTDNTPTEPTVADILRDAASVVRARGWTRGEMWDEKGQVCAVGAIYTLAVPAALRQVAHRAMTAYLGCSTMTWNDIHAADGEQVAQTFEKAAAAWEETVGLP